MQIFIRPMLLCAAVFMLCTASVSAESLRCKNDTVNVGDMRSSVIQRCGEPVFKDVFCRPVEQGSVQRTASGANVVVVAPCENVDEWTYNPGYGQFMTTLRFEGGVITSIKYGDRVN